MEHGDIERWEPAPPGEEAEEPETPGRFWFVFGDWQIAEPSPEFVLA